MSFHNYTACSKAAWQRGISLLMVDNFSLQSSLSTIKSLDGFLIFFFSKHLLFVWWMQCSCQPLTSLQIGFTFNSLLWAFTFFFFWKTSIDLCFSALQLLLVPLYINSTEGICMYLVVQLGCLRWGVKNKTQISVSGSSSLKVWILQQNNNKLHFLSCMWLNCPHLHKTQNSSHCEDLQSQARQGTAPPGRAPHCGPTGKEGSAVDSPPCERS